MIGALGLGLIGTGLLFITAGVRGKSLREVFAGFRPTTAGPVSNPSAPEQNPAAQGPIDVNSPYNTNPLHAIANDPVGRGTYTP